MIVRPEAESDITEAALWYESRESDLGLQLIAEIRAAIGRALNDPEMFPRLRKSPTVRRALARGSCTYRRSDGMLVEVKPTDPVTFVFVERLATVRPSILQPRVD